MMAYQSTVTDAETGKLIGRSPPMSTYKEALFWAIDEGAGKGSVQIRVVIQAPLSGFYHGEARS